MPGDDPEDPRWHTWVDCAARGNSTYCEQPRWSSEIIPRAECWGAGGTYVDIAACRPCADECRGSFDWRCNNDAVEHCELAADGCWDWIYQEQCASGRCYQDPEGTDEWDEEDVALCMKPCDECGYGSGTRCLDSLLQECTQDQDQCWVWQTLEDCAERNTEGQQWGCDWDGGPNFCGCEGQTEYCDGTVRKRCNGFVYQPVEDCADSGASCVVPAPGETACE